MESSFIPYKAGTRCKEVRGLHGHRRNITFARDRVKYDDILEDFVCIIKAMHSIQNDTDYYNFGSSSSAGCLASSDAHPNFRRKYVSMSGM